MMRSMLSYWRPSL